MPKNIAINGFGRIGKAFLRAVMQDTSDIKIVAINLGPSSSENLDAFFRYDSVLGTFNGTVTAKGDTLVVNGHEIKILNETDPNALPWKSLNIDWVVESSGKFTTREKAHMHIKAGAARVLITAPSKDADITIIPGVNDETYNDELTVSLGSCTTNCLAPIVKVLKEHISQGLMTTIHAYTNNQALLDSEHSDPRRGRAAAMNIVPTSTGADKVITTIYPELKGKIRGIALRVPIPLVSLVDFSFTTIKPINAEEINSMFEKASQTNLKNILHYSTAPVVSSDFIGSPYSCIIDAPLTQAHDSIGKVFGWYDNEFGYSCRLKDFLLGNS